MCLLCLLACQVHNIYYQIRLEQTTHSPRHAIVHMSINHPTISQGQSIISMEDPKDDAARRRQQTFKLANRDKRMQIRGYGIFMRVNKKIQMWVLRHPPSESSDIDEIDKI